MKLIDKLSSNPKNIFLIDGLGALLTGISLVLIARVFKTYFEMPQTLLFILSGIGFMLSVYSLSCYLLVKNRWNKFLKIIILANLLYCCLTLVLLICFSKVLSVLDFVYFIGEILIILSVVFIERKTVLANRN